MLEHHHSVAFANWLRAQGYRFYKSPNETYTKSWNQKRKNTLEGVSPGFPDYTIILKRGSLLFLELKKEKGPRGGWNGSSTTPEQAEWINALDALDNCRSCYAHGWEEAVRIVQESEKL